MKIFGIDYAPLFIPIERRRQTFVLFFFLICFGFMGPLAVLYLLYVLFFTRLYFIPLLYIAWYIADQDTPESGGRKLDWVRNLFIWKDYANYFPLNLVKEQDLDPKLNYLIGCHPHGILSFGAVGNFTSEGTRISKVYPGITFSLATLKWQFKLPLYREILMAVGFITSSRRSIEHVLGSNPGGNAVVVVIGGSAEILYANPHLENITLVLKERKGFVRLALKHGAQLVPSFSFGENELYDQVDNPRGSKLRNMQEKVQKKLSIPFVFINGRGIFQYSFGFLPRRTPITTVVGKPIHVERTLNPTEDQINELHSKYINELTALFERHKHKYYPNSHSIKLQLL